MMRGSFRRGIAALAVAVISTAAPLCASATVKYRTLAKLPANFKKRAFAVSTDGNAVAFVERTMDGQRVVYGSYRGPYIPEVAMPQIAKNSDKLFYWGGDPKVPASTMLMADGERIVPGFSDVAEVFFSPDGKRWGTTGAVAPLGDNKTPTEVRVIVDGKVVGTHKDATWPVFSPDSTHVAYIAQQEDDSFRLIIDGETKRVFDKPEKRVAVAATQGESRPALGKIFMIKYLSDGSLLFTAQDRDGWAVYRNDTRLGSYASYQSAHGGVSLNFGDEFISQPAILSSWFGTADKAPVGSWWEKVPTEGEPVWRVTRDGVPMQKSCKGYWEASPPFLSDDGQHIAYQCWLVPPGVQLETKLEMMFDETVLGTYYNVYGIGFSDDGSRIAYAGSMDSSEDGWNVYLHGRYFAMRFVEIWRPRISPDGKHVAWEGKRHKRGVLVFDGDSRGSFDDVLWGPEFLLPDTVSWVIRRGNRIVRVDASY